MSQNIIQLMPARPGWRAAFWHSQKEDEKYGSKAYHLEDLECWALIEYKDGDREIVGVVISDWSSGPRIIGITDYEFVAYDRADDPQDWQEDALKAREMQR